MPTPPPHPKKNPYEISEDLKIMGIRNLHTVARDRKEWRRTELGAKVNNRYCR